MSFILSTSLSSNSVEFSIVPSVSVSWSSINLSSMFTSSSSIMPSLLKSAFLTSSQPASSEVVPLMLHTYPTSPVPSAYGSSVPAYPSRRLSITPGAPSESATSYRSTSASSIFASCVVICPSLSTSKFVSLRPERLRYISLTSTPRPSLRFLNRYVTSWLPPIRGTST